jgi:hypothetical protein
LRQIQQFVLLYPPQGEKGPNPSSSRECRIPDFLTS